nr:RecName: Full=Dextransucrase; AltName: Full=Glucansucrase; AltName: Full=Sucrose 6-glucosyltransferase [Leuconostoc mesenteroides]
DSTNTV